DLRLQQRIQQAEDLAVHVVDGGGEEYERADRPTIMTRFGRGAGARERRRIACGEPPGCRGGADAYALAHGFIRIARRGSLAAGLKTRSTAALKFRLHVDHAELA